MFPDKPVITYFATEPQFLQEGDVLAVRCEVQGDAFSNVTIFNVTDESPYPVVSSSSSSEASFKITNITCYHRGTFRCLAGGAYWSDETEIILAVYCEL